MTDEPELPPLSDKRPPIPKASLRDLAKRVNLLETYERFDVTGLLEVWDRVVELEQWLGVAGGVPRAAGDDTPTVPLRRMSGQGRARAHTAPLEPISCRLGCGTIFAEKRQELKHFVKVHGGIRPDKGEGGPPPSPPPR